MLENEILDKLNDYNESNNIYIKVLKDQESSKELKFIAESRRYSNEGCIVGPATIECAKKCIEIGLTPEDFSFDGGSYGFYFFHYGKCNTLNKLIQTEEYYKNVKSLLKKLNISEKAFDNWIFGNNGTYILTKNPEELDLFKKQLIELKENKQFENENCQTFYDKKDWIYFK